jgi:hypothetical protein
MSKFMELRKLDVKDHIEKKNGLSYLTWSAAVDYLLQHDESATWEFPEPTKFGDTLMVHCNLTAFGKTIKMHLPVMDHRNHAMANPNSVDINKAMMRCLAKAIACFGIGLYIYSGEDLPADAATAPRPEVLQRAKELADPVKKPADPLADIKEMFGAKVVEPTPAEKREIAAQLGDGTDKWFLDVEIHFGKNKGVKLFDLPPSTLRWYADKWSRDEATGAWKSGSTTAHGQKQDLRLREALDAYQKYKEEINKPGKYAGCNEPIRIGDDSVPF